MIDWVEFLAKRNLVSSVLAPSMRERELSWHQGETGYRAFIQSLLHLYKDVESEIDSQNLRNLARVFVLQDSSVSIPNSVGATILGLFRDLSISAHVISGAPMVVLSEYQQLYPCIKRITGITSGTSAGDLLALKRDAVQPYSTSPALFGIGDSETDIPLFESSRHPIGINFAPSQVRNGGLHITADPDLILSSEAESELSAYIRSRYFDRPT